MVGFIRSQLIRRFPRVAALGAGILVASVGFTLLTSSVDTGALTVQGTIRRNFRPAYDHPRSPGQLVHADRTK